MAENEISLKQRGPFGLDIHLNLLSGRELQVTTKGKKQNLVYSVDILSLHNKSKNILFISWKWLATSVSFFLLMLLLLKFLPPYLDTNKNLYLAIIILVGLLGSFTCIVQFFKKISNKKIFFSRNANVPIIILSANKPNKKDFSSFTNTIEKHIITSQENNKLTEERQLSGEMKMLRRLSDQAIISKNAYESAKSKLLNNFDSQLVNRKEST